MHITKIEVSDLKSTEGTARGFVSLHCEEGNVQMHCSVTDPADRNPRLALISEALRQLDKLISGGQPPIALLPQIAWSLRRLGLATAVVEHRERSGRKWQLDEALKLAGINRPADLGRAKSQLKGLGRDRARQLLPWLLDADLRLKGTHSADGRDRRFGNELPRIIATAGDRCW